MEIPKTSHHTWQQVLDHAQLQDILQTKVYGSDGYMPWPIRNMLGDLLLGPERVLPTSKALAEHQAPKKLVTDTFKRMSTHLVENFARKKEDKQLINDWVKTCKGDVEKSFRSILEKYDREQQLLHEHLDAVAHVPQDDVPEKQLLLPEAPVDPEPAKIIQDDGEELEPVALPPWKVVRTETDKTVANKRPRTEQTEYNIVSKQSVYLYTHTETESAILDMLVNSDNTVPEVPKRRGNFYAHDANAERDYDAEAARRYTFTSLYS